MNWAQVIVDVKHYLIWWFVIDCVPWWGCSTKTRYPYSSLNVYIHAMKKTNESIVVVVVVHFSPNWWWESEKVSKCYQWLASFFFFVTVEVVVFHLPIVPICIVKSKWCKRKYMMNVFSLCRMPNVRRGWCTIGERKPVPFLLLLLMVFANVHVCITFGMTTTTSFDNSETYIQSFSSIYVCNVSDGWFGVLSFALIFSIALFISWKKFLFFSLVFHYIQMVSPKHHHRCYNSECAFNRRQMRYILHTEVFTWTAGPSSIHPFLEGMYSVLIIHADTLYP